MCEYEVDQAFLSMFVLIGSFTIQQRNSQTSVEMKAFTEIALLYLEQLTHSILLRFMLKTY